MRDDEHDFNSDDLEKVGEGIGIVGAILTGIAMVVSGIVGFAKLFTDGKSEDE